MSIKTKIIALLLAVSVLPGLFLGALGTLYGQNQFNQFILARVQDVNESKAAKVRAFTVKVHDDVAHFAQESIFREQLLLLAAAVDDSGSSAYRTAKRTVDQNIGSHRIEHNFADVYLISQRGIIVYVADPAESPKLLGTAPIGNLEAAFRQGQSGTYVTTPFILDREGQPDRYFVFGGTSLKDGNGLNIGSVVIEIPLTELYAEVSDTTGLSATGETFLGYNDGFSAVYIMPLRHDPYAAINRRVIFGAARGTPLQRALREQKGNGVGVDYRGEKVLAAWERIEGVNWAIVTKIDAAEVNGYLRNIIRLIAILVPIAYALMITSIIIVVHHWMTKPLDRLAATAENLAKGDYHTPLNHELIYSHDDFGKLATSLHNIAERLKYPRSAEHDAKSNLGLHEHDHDNPES